MPMTTAPRGGAAGVSAGACWWSVSQNIRAPSTEEDLASKEQGRMVEDKHCCPPAAMCTAGHTGSHHTHTKITYDLI